jgi:hypothetical protein
MTNQITHYAWIGILIAIVWSKFLKSYLRSKSIIGIVLLFISCTFIGLWRVNQFHTKYSFADFDRHNNQIITLAKINKNIQHGHGGQH